MMKNYKGVLYGAVAYSVIIGLIYVGLSVVGLMTRWCMIESKGGPLAYMLYLIYFRVESCEANIDWSILNIDGQTVSMPPETNAVYFTFLFLIVYLSLHGLLVFTSFYALGGVNNSCLGRRSFPIFFLPWIIIWWLIIIIDILATVYYIFDIVKLTSVDGLLSILEITGETSSFEELSVTYRIMPPIIMMFTASKVFVFIIANIVWVISITRAGWAASTYHMYHDQTRRNYENTMANVNPAFEGMRDDVVAQKQHEKQMEYLSDQSSIHDVPASSSPRPTASAPPQENVESRYNDTSRVQAQAYPYHMPGTRNEKQRAPQPPKQIPEDEPQTSYKIKRPTTLILPERPPSQQQEHQYQHQNSNQYQNNESDKEIDSRLSRYQETSGNAIRTIEPIKYDDVPVQQQSNTRVLVLPPISESRPHSLKPIPPPKPQNYNNNNNNRFSVQPIPAGRESPVLYRPERTNSARVAPERTSSNVRAPEELRSQLPWSYFKPRDETPKKAFDHLEENEDIPAVPVPDYTLHYGKKGRSNLGDNESDGNWSHSRY